MISEAAFSFFNISSKSLNTPGPWLLWISVVQFSLVRIFKKPYAIFTIYLTDGIPSLMRCRLLKCCGFESCRFLPDIKRCKSQGPGVYKVQITWEGPTNLKQTLTFLTAFVASKKWQFVAPVQNIWTLLCNVQLLCLFFIGQIIKIIWIIRPNFIR